MKVLNPLAILNIGLSAGHVLDVMGVDQPHIDLALLQYLEQWDPVHSGRLHRHGSNLALLKPVCESLQSDGKRWERPNWLFVAPTSIPAALGSITGRMPTLFRFLGTTYSLSAPRRRPGPCKKVVSQTRSSASPSEATRSSLYRARGPEPHCRTSLQRHQ